MCNCASGTLRNRVEIVLPDPYNCAGYGYGKNQKSRSEPALENFKDIPKTVKKTAKNLTKKSPKIKKLSATNLGFKLNF